MRQVRIGEVVGRIEEHHVERPSRRRADRRRRRCGAPRSRHPAPPTSRRARRCAATTDAARGAFSTRSALGRTPADGLEPERTRSRVQIEHGGAAERVGGLEGSEQRLAHPVAGRARARVGHLERDRPGPARDDACHPLTIAALCDCGPRHPPDREQASGALNRLVSCRRSASSRAWTARSAARRQPRSSVRSACARSAICSRTTRAATPAAASSRRSRRCRSASRSRSSPRSSGSSERRMQQRKGSILEVVISDGQGELSLTFFNQAWRIEGSAARAPRHLRRQGRGVPRRRSSSPIPTTSSSTTKRPRA